MCVITRPDALLRASPGRRDLRFAVAIFSLADALSGEEARNHGDYLDKGGLSRAVDRTRICLYLGARNEKIIPLEG